MIETPRDFDESENYIDEMDDLLGSGCINKTFFIIIFIITLIFIFSC